MIQATTSIHLYKVALPYLIFLQKLALGILNLLITFILLLLVTNVILESNIHGLSLLVTNSLVCDFNTLQQQKYTKILAKNS